MGDASLLSVLGQLVPSLAAILGALFLVKRFAAKGRLGGAGTDLKVISRTGLTRNATVAVVEVAGRRFLVGATDQRVELLSEIDTDATPGEAALAAVPTPLVATGTDGTAAASFADVLNLRAATDAASTSADTNGPRIGLVERLQQMTLRSPARAQTPWRPSRDGDR